MSNKVFTYYVDVPGLWSPASQWALIDVWKRSWAKAGWDPIVVIQKDVETHPRFPFFWEHFMAKPTEWGPIYTTACFIRWLAMAHLGGGMLVDYDVINYGFTPREYDPEQMVIFCDDPPGGVFMGAILGSAQHYLDVSEIWAATKASNPEDWNPTINQLHQDDLSLLVRMFIAQNLKKPDWLVVKPGCALFDYPTWTTSKLVHYGYAMRSKGYWPKHEHIEKIRPF
jgi:hypothetical protein